VGSIQVRPETMDSETTAYPIRDTAEATRRSFYILMADGIINPIAEVPTVLWEVKLLKDLS